MVDPKANPQISTPLEEVKRTTDKALGWLQWTDLPADAIVPLCIQSYSRDCEAALDLVRQASLRMEEEATALRSTLDLMKKRLIERKPQEGLMSEALCVLKSIIISRLYPAAEVPLGYLSLASPLPRILMKRRAFT